MAGIYIHIPFCKQACYYCDFHFTTSTKHLPEVVDAICKELVIKSGRLSGENVESIYFGGGTPSILPPPLLHQIFDQIYRSYEIVANAEITLEANPDDLTATKIKELRQMPINRFSVGVQSFYDEDLRWMNRVHQASEALGSIKRCQDAGFENLTLDLIYGFPLLDDKKWLNNIQTAIDLQVSHISAYSLTVEDRTALAHQIKVGKSPKPDEEQSARQFLQLVNCLQQDGFEHYEISNYAKNKQYAIHNTNYWRNKPYLGIGPSAHGYDGGARYMNVVNNMKYLQALAGGNLAETIETLSTADRFNEYVMTALRTMWGIDLNYLSANFGSGTKAYVQTKLQEPDFEGRIILNENSISLNEEGKLFADGLAAALFLEEEELKKNV
jgi:oxygen-independent coproporphyrinogen-3 oxidase